MKKLILITILIGMTLYGFSQKPLNAPNGVKSGNIILDSADFINLDGTTSNIQEQLNSKVSVGDSVLGYTAAEIDALLSSQEPTLLKDLKLIGSTVKSVPYGATTYGVLGGVITSGRVYGMLHIVRDTITVDGIEYGQSVGVPNFYTRGAYNGFDLCSYSSGVLTTIASTANDSTIFKTFGYFRKPFSTTNIVLLPGLYYVRAIFQASTVTAAPAITFCASGGGDLTTILGTQIKTSFYKSSETSLVSPFTLSSGYGSSLMPALHLYNQP